MSDKPSSQPHVLTPDDVLTRYDSDVATRQRFVDFRDRAGGDAREHVDFARSVALHVFAFMDHGPAAIAKSMALFMADLHVPALQVFVDTLAPESARLGYDAQNYLAALNRQLAREQAFIDSIQRLYEAKRRAKTDT